MPGSRNQDSENNPSLDSFSSMELVPPESQGMFKARDGTSIYYEIRGSGRPLIFAYGLTCQMRHWRYQIHHLMSRYSCISFDYRGHHRSSLPKNENHLNLSWCASDIADLMQALQLREAAFLGHSMGVAVLTRLAKEIPERIAGMVFVCGSVENPFQHMFHTAKLDRFYRMTSRFYRWSPQTAEKVWHYFTQQNPFNTFLTSRLGFHPELSHSHDVRMYMQGVHRCPLVTFQMLLEDYQNFEGYAYLSSLKVPVLVVAGESDLITPLHLSEKIAKELPNAELAKIPEGSHNAHIDFPGLVNRRIQDFFSRIQYQ